MSVSCLADAGTSAGRGDAEHPGHVQYVHAFEAAWCKTLPRLRREGWRDQQLAARQVAQLPQFTVRRPGLEKFLELSLELGRMTGVRIALASAHEERPSAASFLEHHHIDV